MTMTRLGEIAKELGLTDMRDLPYSPTEADEVAVLESVMAEIMEIRSQLDRISSAVKNRYAELKAQC